MSRIIDRQLGEKFCWLVCYFERPYGRIEVQHTLG